MSIFGKICIFAEIIVFQEESKGVDLDKVRLEDDELVGLKLGKVYPAKRECTMMKANIE